MGKTVIITGTTQGIGRSTAAEIACAGCRLVMLVRDLAAGGRVRNEIVASVRGARVDVVHCDLASLASVRHAAAEVLAALPAIDCLINNAGIVSMRPISSVDGFELVFATNHLGPFMLTELLRDRVTDGGRIINVASRAHFKGSLDMAQVTTPHSTPYRPGRVYAQSKLANVLTHLPWHGAWRPAAFASTVCILAWSAPICFHIGCGSSSRSFRATCSTLSKGRARRCISPSTKRQAN